MSIPKRIIQTAKTRELSVFARACGTNLTLLHPDWEHTFFDDDGASRFVAREFPEYLPVYQAFPKSIQRVDFFRYLAVYKLGGFYFDLDVLLAKSLLPLLSHACVFSFEGLTLSRHLRRQHRMDWEIGNYAFGCAAGHPFLRRVIENCVTAHRERGWVEPMMADIPRWIAPDFRVLNSTGPGLLSRTLAENPQAAADVTVLFPSDVCDKDQWFGFGDYGVHLMEGSWRSSNKRLGPRLLERWWKSRRRREQLPESLGRGSQRNVGDIWPGRAGR